MPTVIFLGLQNMQIINSTSDGLILTQVTSSNLGVDSLLSFSIAHMQFILLGFLDMYTSILFPCVFSYMG